MKKGIKIGAQLVALKQLSHWKNLSLNVNNYLKSAELEFQFQKIMYQKILLINSCSFSNAM
jgi:hypothetical protein